MEGLGIIANVLAIVFSLAIAVGIFYAIGHFIRKFW